MKAPDTDTDTDTLTVIKLLAAGKSPEFVAAATDLAIGYVQDLADEHGWPDLDALAEAAARLSRDAGATLPSRAPASLVVARHGVTPQPSRPSPTPGSGPRPASPAPGGTPTVVHGHTVAELARACSRSGHKRTQVLGPKLTELADKITTALRAERQAAEAKAKASEEFTAKKAAVDALAKQLADAKAALRGLTPSGAAEAAPEHACTQCGALFTTSQGRGLHTTRVHGAATPTPDTETRSASA